MANELKVAALRAEVVRLNATMDYAIYTLCMLAGCLCLWFVRRRKSMSKIIK